MLRSRFAALIIGSALLALLSVIGTHNGPGAARADVVSIAAPAATTTITEPPSTTTAPTTTTSTTEPPATSPPITASRVTAPPATDPPEPDPEPRVIYTTGEVNGWPCGGDLPPCYVLARESGGNPEAQNPSSTASGLWQFLDSTWDGYAGFAKARYAPGDVQNEKARQLWAGGAGCSHWSACG